MLIFIYFPVFQPLTYKQQLRLNEYTVFAPDVLDEVTAPILKANLADDAAKAGYSRHLPGLNTLFGMFISWIQAEEFCLQKHTKRKTEIIAIFESFGVLILPLFSPLRVIFLAPPGMDGAKCPQEL